MNRMKWASVVSTHRASYYLLNLKETILKSHSSAMSCSSKKLKKKKTKKHCVILGIMKKLPILCVFMNIVQKHNDLDTPQKVEGALG